MNSRSILIYGGGNCEIASVLDEELNHITHLSRAGMKVFARGHFFNNSCIAMYRRFKELKEDIGESGQGGVHDYFYDNGQVVKTCELKMKAASSETFEEFLKVASLKIAGDEVILILIGQGDLSGLFWDFSETPPTCISYKRLVQILMDAFEGKVKKLSLIIDVSNWHNVYLPLCLSQCHLIESVFIYERKKPLEIFPIARWIDCAFDEEYHWTLATYLYFGGYKVDLHPVWWHLCEKRWRDYTSFPSVRSFEEFYTIYKKIVMYYGTSNRIYSKILREKAVFDKQYVTTKDIQVYFEQEYLCKVSEEEIEKWLNELKICTDYYKG
ncbi:MAG: hypothetical protein K0S30_158 [Clostridia bacterium]|jgi:hypothetical protein|nr:hypothetical protein [Clostridia bacterium]